MVVVAVLAGRRCESREGWGDVDTHLPGVDILGGVSRGRGAETLTPVPSIQRLDGLDAYWAVCLG